MSQASPSPTPILPPQPAPKPAKKSQPESQPTKNSQPAKKSQPAKLAPKKPAKKPATKSQPAKLAPKKPAKKPATKRKASTAKDTVLATPKKGRRSPEDLPPGVRSPFLLGNGLTCVGCDHDNLKELVPCEENCFTEALLLQDNYPTRCVDCEKLLLKGRHPPATHCKIGGILSVKCCKNALNHRDHKCVWAVCTPCHQKREDAAKQEQAKHGAHGNKRKSSRMRKERDLINVGETRLRNGDIIG